MTKVSKRIVNLSAFLSNSFSEPEGGQKPVIWELQHGTSVTIIYDTSLMSCGSK